VPWSDLDEDGLVVVDRDGGRLAGREEPSSEIRMHLQVYQVREDVRAVIHAHPPTATAFTVAGVPLPVRSLPEILVTLGDVPTAPYAAPATPELAQGVASLVAESDALLLERQGSLTLGRGLGEAFERLERLEWAAQVLLRAKALGEPRDLSDAQVEELLAIRARLAGGS
jgi:L-fuculose-phosphate aldolase